MLVRRKRPACAPARRPSRTTHAEYRPRNEALKALARLNPGQNWRDPGGATSVSR